MLLSFFFLMIRRPPRSTLFSLHDALPICQMLHGHWATAPVVKLQENGLLIGVPELFCAPDHRTGTLLNSSRTLVGENVVTLTTELKVSAQATTLVGVDLTVNSIAHVVTAA